jgi:2-oxoisovalerate dehydrogenase E1 component alpha subunit
MPKSMLQVLSAEGIVQNGQSIPSLAPKKILELYRLMLLNRRIDERMIKLQRQGRIAFYVGSIGEEAATIGSAAALEKTDWIVPAYRELGAALLRGYTLQELCNQLFGNSQDTFKGRQMPSHYSLPHLHYASVSSPVGTQIPHATGLALGAKLTGKKDIALVYFGDGATSTGDFHAAANFAGSLMAPVIFLCRNNQWAISVPVDRQTANPSLASKAVAYGFEGVCVDGNDALAVYNATRDAAEHARQGHGPVFIEAYTYRLTGHSTSDDPRSYRDDEEVRLWEGRDPLKRLRLYLVSEGHWNEKKDRALEAEIKDAILSAIRKAEAHGPPPIDTIFTDVFDKRPWNLKEQQAELERSLGALAIEPTA